MGHACNILTFPATTPPRDIQARCDAWGNANADLEERGGVLCGLGSSIRFTNAIYETREDAENYLEGTFGNYSQIAVRYKVPKKGSSGRVNTLNTKIEDLQRRIKEYHDRIVKLDEPHYKGVSSKTVKCKNCGAVLPTEYCGKTYTNKCPVCRNDLRPATVMNNYNKYVKTYNDLVRELHEMQRTKQVKAMAAGGYDLYWAVACEVHC